MYCPECKSRNLYCHPEPVELVDRTGKRIDARVYDCENCGNFFSQPVSND